MHNTTYGATFGKRLKNFLPSHWLGMNFFFFLPVATCCQSKATDQLAYVSIIHKWVYPTFLAWIFFNFPKL